MIEKYKNWIILGAIGLGVYVFFYVKIVDNRTHTLYELLKNIAILKS